LHVEFLEHFARQCNVISFTRINFATRKLPITAKTLMGSTATSKNFAIAFDDGGNDNDGFHRHSLELVAHSDQR